MFIAPLFIKAQGWKQPKGFSTEERIKQVWYIHTMEYDLAIKRMKYMTTWTNFENTILSERSQTQKTTYPMISFIGNVLNREIYKDRE